MTSKNPPNMDWLMFSTPLKNISSSVGMMTTEWKVIKFMFQTRNQWRIRDLFLTCAKRREFSGMIHWLTNYHGFHPSNPQQPIYSLRKTHCRSPRGRLEDAFVARFHQRRPKPFLEGVLLHLQITRPAFRGMGGMGDVHRKTIGKPQENHRTTIGKWWFTPLNIGIS